MEKIVKENIDLNIKNYVLVGRPNVGKSSIFNFLIGKHEAFVKDEEGTTVDWRSKKIGNAVFWDTPGVFNINEMPPCKIDKVLFVVESNILNIDKQIYLALKKKYKDLLVIVNKIDKDNNAEYENYTFFDYYVLISLKSRKGLTTLKTHIKIDFSEQDKRFDKKIWAIVGKPNVGKSSLTNFLAKKDIHKVEDFEGTTKEFLPVEIEENIILDTPGQRKKAIFPQYSNVFGALFVIDLKQERQDLKILGLMSERKKNIIVLINKTDLAKSAEVKKVEEKISKIWNFPVLKISCKTGAGLKSLNNLIKQQEEGYSKRITTSQLNKWLKEEVFKVEPRLKFISQIDVGPPKFFLDFKLELHKEKMLKKRLAAKFGFNGVPILIKYKEKID